MAAWIPHNLSLLPGSNAGGGFTGRCTRSVTPPPWPPFAFAIQVFLAIDRQSHSVTDTLYRFYTYAAPTFLGLMWIASRTSGEKRRWPVNVEPPVIPTPARRRGQVTVKLLLIGILVLLLHIPLNWSITCGRNARPTARPLMRGRP